MLMEAHEAYKAGNTETALLKYAMLAELGYEVAQSNVAYILDHGLFTFSLFSYLMRLDHRYYLFSKFVPQHRVEKQC